MKKNDIFFSSFLTASDCGGYILAKRLMISPINEIVSIDEPVNNEHAGKKSSPDWKTLAKSERKVAEVILATPAQAIHSSIAALALKPASASRP